MKGIDKSSAWSINKVRIYLFWAQTMSLVGLHVIECYCFFLFNRTRYEWNLMSKDKGSVIFIQFDEITMSKQYLTIFTVNYRQMNYRQMKYRQMNYRQMNYR